MRGSPRRSPLAFRELDYLRELMIVKTEVVNIEMKKTEIYENCRKGTNNVNLSKAYFYYKPDNLPDIFLLIFLKLLIYTIHIILLLPYRSKINSVDLLLYMCVWTKCSFQKYNNRFLNFPQTECLPTESTTRWSYV